MRHVLPAMVALVLALPTGAVATHMAMYSMNPVDHDDQGRVDEPDFAATSLLGPEVRNCIASFGPGQRCIEDADLPPKQGPWQADAIAPGCSDDDGRQPSGMCGLWTVGAGTGATGTVVPPGTAGVRGRSDDKAPGRLTPTKASTVRFLDARFALHAVLPAGGTTYLDLNHKLADAHLPAGSAFIPPIYAGLWAMFGAWQDKNGNGVVDHLGSGTCFDDPTRCEPDGGVRPDNEFVWMGRCIQFDGSPAPIGQRFCEPQSLAMPVWVVPGNHHATCSGYYPSCNVLSPLSWPDLPGRQAVCFADILLLQTLPSCAGSLRDLDQFDESAGGDPLLGPQGSVKPDGMMGDRTGDALDTARMWVQQTGWPSYYYDESLVVTTTVVAAATPQLLPDLAVPQRFDLARATFTDVDRYTSWAPLLGEVLQEQVKPAARGNWVLVRDSLVAIGPMRDDPLSARVFYDQCDTSATFEGACAPVGAGPLRGRIDDAIGDPGFAHEPNDPRDVEPGAVRRACPDPEETFRGWCNDYTGYVRGARAWLDVVQHPAIYTSLAWQVPGMGCLLCVTGPPTGLPYLPPGLPRAPGDHTRVLQPGSHTFSGAVGAWQDRAHRHLETALDLRATAASLVPSLLRYDYTVGPDTWVGDLVNNTGALRSRGYGPTTCTIGGETREREYAECDPYLGGNVASPQGYSTRPEYGGEFCAAEQGEGGSYRSWLVRLEPEGGTWNVPVFVWRSFDTWSVGRVGDVEEHTGSTDPIVLRLGSRPSLLTRDVLILPAGNVGQAVTMTVEGTAVVRAGPQCPAVAELVRDVDVFGPYGG